MIIQDEEIVGLWKSIDKYHHDLHNAGKQTLLHIKNQEMQEANKNYQIAKESSIKVNQLLDSIINILKNDQKLPA